MQRLLAVVVLLLSSVAHADGIVLEVYTGAKPADAKLLAPLLGELATRGFVGGYDGVGRKLEQVSLPATTPESRSRTCRSRPLRVTSTGSAGARSISKA